MRLSAAISGKAWVMTPTALGRSLCVMCFVALQALAPASGQAPPRISMEGVSGNLILQGEETVTRHFIPYYNITAYVPRDLPDLSTVRSGEAPARISMQWLLHSMNNASLSEYWGKLLRDGGVSDLEYQQLEPMRERFSRFFDGCSKGDEFLFEYLPDAGMRISVNGADQGVMAGLSFNRWLLSGLLDELEKAAARAAR